MIRTKRKLKGTRDEHFQPRTDRLRVWCLEEGSTPRHHQASQRPCPGMWVASVGHSRRGWLQGIRRRELDNIAGTHSAETGDS
ncbi:Protein of unknown function [Gryllus bimaculatus]|nr:Protein of unknown function [Gryllus bimaculatus]